MLSISPLTTLLVLLPSTVRSTSFLPFLDFTSPSPYIFHSLATLLQTYPQTLFPNGHTIASVTFPRHTLLYHGRHDNDSVPSPEWLALDVEMAYGIMGNLPDSRMLTYRTTKNVKAVYFDGTSANLMGEGTTSQMVLLFNGTENIPKRGGWGPPGRGPPGRGPPDHDRDQGNIEEEDPPRRPPGDDWNPLKDEYFRARGLCKWLESRGLGGLGWGYEGIVRMNAGFEVIWCDFESPSLKLVSNLNVSVPLLSSPNMDSFQGRRPDIQTTLRTSKDEGPHGPGMTSPREPFRESSTWYWFAAAAKRYWGESRIKVDACGMFSFYEPALQNQSRARQGRDEERLNLTANGEWKAPSDDLGREQGIDKLSKRRRQHRLDSVEELDGDVMLQAVEERLMRALETDGCSSGNNWHHISQEIITLYGGEIQSILHHLQAKVLRSTGEESDLRTWLTSIRSLTHWFMLPFLEYPPGRPYDQKDLKKLFDLESPMAHKTLERCKTQYDTDERHFSDEDALLYTAVKDTIFGLCSTIIEIGLGVEYHWLSDFNTVSPNNLADAAEPYERLLYDARVWKMKVEELMAWLGWMEKWTGYADSCAGGIPYVPMWPVSGNGGRRRPPPDHGDGGKKADRPRFEWGDSKFLWGPVCVNASSYPPEEWE